mmetsp:Transcript_23221/g.69640  ORF Transcript_23221/g.69640 Transcript_23221/m.69640 type:complete len:266 (-) Transcript_23221:103-900(-)
MAALALWRRPSCSQREAADVVHEESQDDTSSTSPTLTCLGNYQGHPAVFEVHRALAPDACDRARDAVNDAFDNGRTTDRGVSLPTQDVMVSSLPPRCQDEIRDALERTARRASQELPNCTLEFSMSRAFVIVYDAGLKGQRGLKKHTDGRKEGATLLLLISKPRRDFEGGGTRFFPSVLEASFDAKPGLGSTIVFPSDTLQHEGLPIKRGRRLLVCVFATKKKIGAAAEASSDATETRPAEGSALTKIAKHDEQVLAQECACVVS